MRPPDHDDAPDEGRSAEIERILDECMEILVAGGTVDMEQVLASHQGLRAELEPRLRSTLARAQQAADATLSKSAPTSLDAAADSPTIGIPGFRLLRELHRGGQGVVYEAVQEATRRKVAIKVLLKGTYASAADRKRFEREIRLAAQFKHPNIVTIFHSDQTPDRRQFCVMDYIRGLPLDRHVREKKLRMEDALRLFGMICDAVSYAHERKVIHRDLKPLNVLVDAEGRPHVLDFGLAKLLGAPLDSVVSVSDYQPGTLPYMSPEQVRGNADEIDATTDVYSLGVMLYQILTGGFPYPVTGPPSEIFRHISSTDPTLPSQSWQKDAGVSSSTSRGHRSGQCPIDDDVQTIVMKALAKERKRRYASAADLERDIQHYLAGEPIQAKPYSAWYRARRSLRRHRERVAYAVSLSVVVLATALMVRTLRHNSHSVQPEATLILEGDVQRNIERGVPSEMFSPPSRDSEVDRDATLNRNFPDREPADLSTITLGSVLESQDLSELSELLFDTLYFVQADGSLIFNNAMLESDPEWFTDHARFRIKQGSSFQDGTPLTGESVAACLNSAWSQQPTTNGKISAEANRDGTGLTVRFSLTQIQARRSLRFPIYRQLSKSTKINAIVGSGAYRPGRCTANDISLERWDQYSGMRPYFKTMVFRHCGVMGRSDPMLDRLTAKSFFINRQIDEFSLVEDEAFHAMVDREQQAFRQVGEAVLFVQNKCNVVLWNMDKQPRLFRDRQCRRALAQAFNLSAAMRANGLDDMDQINRLFLPFWVPHPISHKIRFDTDAAKRSFADAGWVRNGEVLTRRDADGHELTFEFTLITQDDVNARLTNLLDRMCEDLKSIGVIVHLQRLSTDQWNDRQKRLDFDAELTAFSPGLDPEKDRIVWASRSDQVFSPSVGYENSRALKLFDEGSTSDDVAARRATYSSLQDLIYDDQPVMFLCRIPGRWALSKHLRGVQFGFRGLFQFYPGVRAWWKPLNPQ